MNYSEFRSPGSTADSTDAMPVDLNEDDSMGSGILKTIARDGLGEPLQEEPSVSGPEISRAKSPFFLASLYFRSFGTGTLLTREQELAFAKLVDEGTRRIRAAIGKAIAILKRAKQIPETANAMDCLSTARGLSGFSAPALNSAEEAIVSLCRWSEGGRTLSSQMTERLTALHRELIDARRVLETGKDELVRHNLRLVVDIAKNYTSHSLTLLDLVQEGNIGLMKAAERYQYRKGFKFSTYATWWVRQCITRALAEKSRTIRIPVHQSEATSRIARVRRRLGQQLGRPPRIEEIAKVLRMRPERLEETLQAFQEPVALETPIGDSDGEIGALLPDTQTLPPDTYIHRAEKTLQMERLLLTLTPREALVIRLRFGIDADESLTLEQVGEQLHVTRERIRQIEVKALQKLRTPEIHSLFESIK
jgi:RNA polymerase primary sigma factor